MKFSDYLSELKAIYEQQDAVLELEPPLTDRRLRRAENELDFNIEPGLRMAWLTANGARHYATVFSRPGYLTGYEFPNLDAALEIRAAMEQRAKRYGDYEEPRPRDRRVRSGWFQPGWLPFADFGGLTLLLMMDHSPSDSGRVGQIIAFTHDPDQIDYVAPSFEQFLRASLENIRRQPEDCGIE